MVTSKQNYNLVAGSYDFLSNIYSTGKIKAAKLQQLEWVPPNSKMIYLGCGSGEEVIQAAKLGHDVTAIDMSSKMIGRLQAKLDSFGLNQVRLVNQNVLEFSEYNQFDFVAANFFFNVFDSQSINRIVDHALKLLNDCGKLLIAEIALPTGSVPARVANWTYINSAQLSCSLLGLVSLHKNHDYQALLAPKGWHQERNQYFRLLNFGPIMFQSMSFSNSK